MRTTIEIKPDHLSRLLAIAAKRGEKGFSGLIGEAVEAYLGSEAERQRRRQKALQVRGALRPRDAARLRKKAATLRSSWR
jgi:metal-responsive CopG/Arc/MetJ family transcriptional regulator